MTWQTFDAISYYALPALSAVGLVDLLRMLWLRFRGGKTLVVPPRWRAPQRGWGKA